MVSVYFNIFDLQLDEGWEEREKVFHPEVRYPSALGMSITEDIPRVVGHSYGSFVVRSSLEINVSRRDLPSLRSPSTR